MFQTIVVILGSKKKEGYGGVPVRWRTRAKREKCPINQTATP